MNADVKQLQALLEKTRSLHQKLYLFGQEVMEQAKSNRYAQTERVDLGFLFRELEQIHDEDRKDAKARKELLGKLIAFNAMQTDGDVDSIRGELATGIPDVSMIVELPKRDSAEYTALVNHLGVPQSVLSLLKLDWTAVCAHVTQCAENGRKPPPGLEKSRPIYSTTFRRKSK
jgi:hypothetical protein